MIVLVTGTFALSFSLSPFIIRELQAESEYKYNTNNYNNINFNIPTKIKELINEYSKYYSSEYGYYLLDKNLAYYIPKDLPPDIIVSTNFHAIQPSIDAANDGDVIKVLPGTYTEQLNITKSLTIIGSGVNSTIIEAPAPIKNIKHNINGLPLNINSDSQAQVIIKGFYYKISGFYK